jgi:hypothetical protein
MHEAWSRLASISAERDKTVDFVSYSVHLKMEAEPTSETQQLKLTRMVKTIQNNNLLTYGTEPFLRSCQLCSPSRTPQHFMEPEGSIPCS